MDLPEAPESLAAFSALAAGEEEDGSGDAKGGKSKKGRGKKGKGKGKKRGRKGGAGGADDKPETPKRPSDPLPDCRRTRLVDYLQPISTMLDACTFTKPPPLDEGGDDGGGGGGDAKVDGGKAGGGRGKGFQPRAYDGTLADFLGLALVEHFAARLPRTLAALFEDFECHPPEVLTAALTETPTTTGCTAAGGAAATGNDAGGGGSKEADAEVAAGASSVAGLCLLRSGLVLEVDSCFSPMLKCPSGAGPALFDGSCCISYAAVAVSGCVR